MKEEVLILMNKKVTLKQNCSDILFDPFAFIFNIVKVNWKPSQLIHDKMDFQKKGIELCDLV